MFDGPALVQALRQCGVTHVVWIPDSETGRWEPALRAAPDLRLIRVCREGEAIGVAAGLLLGGQFPAVIVQCTGLFEAGDALRNVVHDLKLPLFLIVGLRSYLAAKKGPTFDSCPVFTEPVLRAWNIRYRLLDENGKIEELIAVAKETRDSGQAGAILLAE
jgi:sulfopyruvate decarboxylase TPP-binding subunit